MKKTIITLAAVALIVTAAVYIRWPVGHIPTYDAKLVRLAETPAQGYCAGIVYWKDSGAGSAWQVRDCLKAIAAQPKKYPTYISLSITQKYFCKGIQASGYNGTVADCVSILDSYVYWPTYNGTLSANWSQTRPYPKTTGPSIGS